MSAIPTQTQAERDQEEALHYRAMARRLADMAMQMAEDIFQHAQASPQPAPPEPGSAPPEPGSALPEPAAPKPDHTERFERASRTVRRAILLARKLAEPLPQPRPISTPAPDRTAARKRIIRAVEDAIHRRHRQNPSDAETLEAELLDRLDRPDLEHDLATRALDDIITDLARDLGVGIPHKEIVRIWKPRTHQDIATLEARAAKPLPTAPGSARTPVPIPLPWRDRIELPEDDAEAIAMVLAMGRIQDG